MSRKDGWSPEEDELIAKLWKDGMSAKQISGAIPGRSRESVLGRVHRKGLDPRRKTPGQRTNELQSKPRLTVLSNAKFRAKAPLVFIPTKAPTIIAGQTPKSLFEREYRECAYPVSGDGADLLYCAAVTDDGEQYCNVHKACMYKPSTRKAKTAGRRY